jgi:hypothetical protein
MIKIIDLGGLAKRQEVAIADSWEEAYALRDALQNGQLAAGYNLWEHRFALRPIE